MIFFIFSLAHSSFIDHRLNVDSPGPSEYTNARASTSSSVSTACPVSPVIFQDIEDVNQRLKPVICERLSFVSRSLHTIYPVRDYRSTGCAHEGGAPHYNRMLAGFFGSYQRLTHPISLIVYSPLSHIAA